MAVAGSWTDISFQGVFFLQFLPNKMGMGYDPLEWGMGNGTGWTGCFPTLEISIHTFTRVRGYDYVLPNVLIVLDHVITLERSL